MKITLVYAGLARIGWNSFNTTGAWGDDCWTIPAGLMYIKNALLRDGRHEVEIIDLRQLHGEEELRDKLRHGGSDVVGVSFLTPSRDYGVLTAKIAKELGKITLAGGVHASAVPDDLVHAGYFDSVVVGEGENAVLEILDLIEKKAPLPPIYRARNFVTNLDDLAFPALAYAPTYDASAFAKNGHMAGILGSRGCPGRCKYCWPNQTIMYGTNKIRLRSPENIVAEMMHLKDNYAIQLIAFYDDTFTWNREWLRQFHAYVRRQRIPIPALAISARANYFDAEIAGLLKDLGCIGVWFGFESGSPRMLQLLNKQCTVEQNIAAAQVCKAAGFDLNANILVGVPGETEADYILTYKFLEQIEPFNVRFNVLSPFPGSAFYEEYSRQGLIAYDTFEDFEVGRIFRTGKGIIKNVDYELVLKWQKPYASFAEKAHLQRRVTELEQALADAPRREQIISSYIGWQWIEKIEQKPRLKKLVRHSIHAAKYLVAPFLNRD